MDTSLGPPLKLFFCEGQSSYPKEAPEAVLSTFGPEALQRVEALAAEIGHLTPDWSIHDLTSATEWAMQEMRRRHSDLDEEGLRVLGWAFSYRNK